jgi:hypothetical protein
MVLRPVELGAYRSRSKTALDDSPDKLARVLAYLFLALAVGLFLAYLQVAKLGNSPEGSPREFFANFIPSATVALLAFPFAYHFFLKHGIKIDRKQLKTITEASAPPDAEQRRETYSFVTGSPEEASFFAGWYSQHGAHDIFCDDLDWLGGAGFAIRQAMASTAKLPGSTITVYRRVDHPQFRKELEDAGVQIRSVPDFMQTEVRFSLRSHDGDRWLIIRDKTLSDTTTTFIKTGDDYTVALARDFFRACISASETTKSDVEPKTNT